MAYLPTSDFELLVARGKVPGHSLVHKFGRNPDIDTGTTPENIWAAGGLITWPTAAATLSVVSDSTNDDGSPAGSGAQIITIEGLDSNFDEVSESLGLNGTVAVTSVQSYIRVNRAYVSRTGTYTGNNVGNITGTHSGNSIFYIEAGKGQTQIGHYTVPNGKTAYVTTFDQSIDSSKTANVETFIRTNADDVTAQYNGVKRLVGEFDGLSGADEFTYRYPRGFPQKTDLIVECDSVSANNTQISVAWTMVIVDEVDF